MESDIRVHIHHGGEFMEMNYIKYYKGGNVECAYNLSMDLLSISILENYVRSDLGYKGFKIYWHKSGSLFDDCSYKLLWNDASIEEMKAYALKSGKIDVYIDHASEKEVGSEDSNHESVKNDDSEESADESDKNDGSEESADESEIEDESENSEDEDYNVNLNECDDEWDEVMERKKKVHEQKSNPIQSTINEGDLTIPLSSLTAKKDTKDKKKEVVEQDKGWESEYDSDSYKIVGIESSDSSDNEADSVGKKKGRKSMKVYPSFNIRTPMKNIEFEPGLMFTDVKTLRNAIIDYSVEHKREIGFKKNYLQRLQAKCRKNCPWYLYASKVDETGAFQMKNYIKDHNCILVHQHELVTSDWLLRKFGDKVRANPKWKVREIRQHVYEMHDLVGLKHAIDNILPAAEHRCCARHICANWKKNHPGTALKNLFWMGAKSYTVEEFNLHMDEIKVTKCDMVDNNLSECFNSWIVDARYKPILELLDDIRLQVMERLYRKRDWMQGVDSTLCPRIIKKLNYNIEGTRFCKSTWVGGNECELRDIDGGQWVVDMVQMTCTCRRWELSGIPCNHACQALQSMNQRPEEKGRLYWPKTGFPDIIPPKVRRMPDRPKKHRRREQGEVGADQKLGKKGMLMRCSRCLKSGHNKATCKATPEEISEIQKGAAEAKKAQSEEARAQVLLNRSKRATSQKTKPATQGETSTQDEPQQKRKRGRPPKAKNVQILEPPPKVSQVGVGVYTNDKDGHTYFSTIGGSTVKVSSSQPPPPKPPISSSQSPSPKSSLNIFQRRSKGQSSSQP